MLFRSFMMKELHVIVTGKVQGVWFRAWTRDTAREMGVTGWVRNQSDGNVEAVGQADEELLKQFLKQLFDGPPLARVVKIDSAWREAETEFSSFEIRQ